MPWKKVSPELCALLKTALEPFDCQNKPMFGCPAYFVNGNMFAGVHQDALIIRLSPADREKIFKEVSRAEQFEPMPGRPMKEYVALPPTVYENLANFHSWLERSYGYAVSLPPKEKPRKRS